MVDKHFVIADVFADAAFAGNQLAVFTDATGLDAEEMQRAANEIGFSETTFVLPPESDDTHLRLRVFTPKTELPFAGHPLVGSGFVAAARRLAAGNPTAVRFGTGVGTIEVAAEVESPRHGRASMRQPFPQAIAEIADPAEVAEIAAAIGADTSSVGGPGPVAVMDNGLRMMIVPLDSLASVAALESNLHAVRRVCERWGARTLLAFSTETVHASSSAHCRVFAPAAGVAEDAATGSANGPFGVYLATHGLTKSDVVVSEQGFEMGRPSRLSISLERDAAGELVGVRVGGGVHLTGEGTMFF
jgi:trans-2,3-dihydro-3-hydroxyanthranilate isomerase